MVRRLLAVSLVVLLAALGLSAQSKPTYTVGTVKELLKNLGPNRTIVLKKGDYQLWTAYDQSGPNYGWLEGDDGKELTIDNADNLTIRGADGARLLTNSLKAYLIGFYGSSNLELDNLVFARQIQGDEVPDAGMVYVETVTKLSISRSSFAGPSGYPLEIWDCGDVSLRDLKVAGGVLGALSVGQTKILTVKGGSVSKVEGYPLVYSEKNGSLTFDGTAFADNSGGNFVEIYPNEGEESSLLFKNCSFARNQFEYFSGTSNLPETQDCSFDGSSFDESWADNSVNLVSDESYGDYTSDTTDYSDDESGLYFSYPSGWDYQEGKVQGRVAIFSNEDDSMLFFSKASEVTTAYNAAKDGPRLFARALASFVKILKDEGGMTLAVSPATDQYTWESGLQTEYTGTITKPDGSKAEARLRLTLLSKGVWALLALAPDQSLLEDGATLETALSSLSVNE